MLYIIQKTGETKIIPDVIVLHTIYADETLE